MKKLLSILLATMMMITMTTTVFADSAVAEVNGTTYDTLQEAINAASNADTVKVLKDVTTSETIEIAKDLTLDLNGKTISYNGTGYDAVCINGKKLIIQDSSTGGKIVRTNDNVGTDVISLFYGAELVLNSGTLEINGGSTNQQAFVLYVDNGVAKINGGKLVITGNNKDIMIAATLNDTASVVITDGVITANGASYPFYSFGGSMSITGGTFDFAPTPAEDYTYEDNGDGTYSVKEMEKNIQVQGKGNFTTLAKAFAAVEAGGVISIEAPGNYIWPNIAIPADVTVKGVVDGVIATSDGSTTINATTLTVENIDFEAYHKAAFINNGVASEMTFSNCSFTPTAGPEFYAFHVDDSAADAEITFLNCEFNGLVTLTTEVTQINVIGGKINYGIIARQDMLIDNVTFAEDAKVQLGTNDKVSGIELTITDDCSVEDTNGDGIVPELKGVLNPNGNDDPGAGNSVLVGKEPVVGSSLRFDLDPTDATVVVKDRYGDELTVQSNGSYVVAYGAYYTYTVSKSGYVTETGELNKIDQSEVVVKVELAKEEVKVPEKEETKTPDYFVPNTGVK